jgi:hypothetical protein
VFRDSICRTDLYVILRKVGIWLGHFLEMMVLPFSRILCTTCCLLSPSLLPPTYTLTSPMQQQKQSTMCHFLSEYVEFRTRRNDGEFRRIIVAIL